MNQLFKTSVSHINIFDTLTKFYSNVNLQIQQNLETVNYSRNDIIELQNLNKKFFSSAINGLHEKKNRIEIQYVTVEITTGLEKRVSTKVDKFEIEFRYGYWFKHDNVL